MEYVMRIECSSDSDDESAIRNLWDAIDIIAPHMMDNVTIQVVNGDGVEL